MFNFFRKQRRKSHRKPAGCTVRRCMTFEPLEIRQMMAADVSVLAENNLLTISGTNGNDENVLRSKAGM